MVVLAVLLIATVTFGRSTEGGAHCVVPVPSTIAATSMATTSKNHLHFYLYTFVFDTRTRAIASCPALLCRKMMLNV